MNIIAFTNNEVSVPSLQYMKNRGWLSAIVTPDQQHEGIFKIWEFARQSSVPILQLNKVSMEDPAFIDWLKQYRPESIFVFTFPFILSDSIIDCVDGSCFNFHFGLLPEYRGADPIFWQIRNGENKGGISVHKMEAKIDAGPLVLRKEIPVEPDETYGMHVVKLAFATPDLVAQLVQDISNNSLQLSPQDTDTARIYGKPELKDVIIDWQLMDAASIKNLTRATNPWNRGAITSIKGIPIKIVAVSEVTNTYVQPPKPGTIIEIHPDGIIVACCDEHCLKVEIVYLEEGILPARALVKLGARTGDCFEVPLLQAVS